MGSLKIEEMKMGSDKVKATYESNKFDEEKPTKSVIVKDMGIACAGFFLNFVAFGGTATLQSSVNSEGNLGTNSFTALSVCGMIANLFIVTIIVSKLGLKWSLIVTLFLRTSYPAANLYSTWYTMYPAAIISGLAGAPLVAAFTGYLTLLSKQYAHATREPIEAATSKFFGVFFMVQRSSHLMSNLISSMILKRPQEAHNLPQDIIAKTCGANYCFQAFEEMPCHTTNSSFLDVYDDSDDLSNATFFVDSASDTMMYRPSRNQIYLLFGVFVVCSLLSGPLLILIRPIKKNKLSNSNTKTSTKTWNKILATFRQMKNLKSVLLIPLSAYCGVAVSFTLVSFSVGFITCAFGIDSIGYVMLVSGAAGALSAVFICGLLTQYVGRKVIFVIAACGSFAVLIAMLNWSPVSEYSMTTLYVISGVWGACCTIWLSQLSAFVGLLSTEESGSAAYACHNLWQAVGLSIWQATSVHICIYVQIYIMLIVLSIGTIGYVIIEVILHREEKLKLKLEEVTTKL